MIKKYIGLVIAILGIVLLAYNIYLQRLTKEPHVFYLAIGVALNAFGVMYHLIINRKQPNE